MTDRKDLRPKQFLELKVFVCDVEDVLALITIDLIEDSVRNHLLKDTLISVQLKEVLMALWVWDDIVYEDADLVSETLVILLVALSENHFKGSFERRDHFRVDRKLVNGLLSTDLNQVPEDFYRKRDNIRPEVFCFADDAH